MTVKQAHTIAKNLWPISFGIALGGITALLGLSVWWNIAAFGSLMILAILLESITNGAAE